MSAAECLDAGLALEVLPLAELLPRVMDRAQTLAALPMASLKKTKALMLDPIRQQLKDSVRFENQGLAELSGGPANREALAAFKEKRAPDFTGL